MTEEEIAPAPDDQRGLTVPGDPEDTGTQNVGRRMVSGVRWSLLDQAVQQVVRMLVNVVLARLVAPESFGVLAMALVVTQVSMFVADAGLGPAVVHRDGLEKRHTDVAFTFTSALGVVLTGVVLLLARPMGSFFHEPELPPVLAALSVVFLVKGLHAVPLDLLRRALRFDRTAVVASAGTLAGASVGVTMAFLGAGVWALVGYAITEAVVACGMAMVMAARLGLWQPGVSLDRRALRDLAPYGAFVTGSRFLAYGIGNFDNAIVGRVLGSIALGYYSLAYRIVLFPIQRIADAVALVTFPAFARMQGERARLQRLYLQSLEIIALICIPATVGVAVAAPPLVRAVFGERWAGAVTAVEILALSGPKLALTRLNSSVFLAVGRPKWDFLLTIVDFVFFLTGFLIGVQHGLTGVALGFTLAGYCALPIDLLVCGRALDVSIVKILGAISRVGVATAVMTAAAMAVRLSGGSWSPILELSGIVVVGAAVYVATISVVAPGLIPQTARRFRNG